MAHSDIEDMLHHLRRIKDGDDLNSNNVDQIERLETALRLFRTFVKYHHVPSPDSLVKIAKITELTGERFQDVLGGNNEYKIKFYVKRLESQLVKFMGGNYTSLRYNHELKDSYLSGYMDYLGMNLNDVRMFLKLVYRSYPSSNKKILLVNRFLKETKIVKKKLGRLRGLYDMKINGYVHREKLEGLETRIRFMADNVLELCFDLWVYAVKYDRGEDDSNSSDVEDDDNILCQPSYILCLIVLVEVEMEKIFLAEPNTSEFSQSRTSKNQTLPKVFSHHFRNLLVHFRKKKLENFPDNVSARNIGVSIELLGFLADAPNHVINDKMLNEVLEKVGALVGDVLCVTKKLLPNSLIKDDISNVNLCSIQILEKTETLKAQVLERYYKSFKFVPFKFPIVGGLSFLDCLLRKLNEMLKSESALDFMMYPQVTILDRELSSLTSVFRNVAKMQHKHEVFKDLQMRTISLAYEAEISIDSILAQYNALWHLFCSLPAILKKVKQISIEVTEMRSENLALKSFSVVKPSKSLPTQNGNPMNDDEEVVGFEDNIQGMIQHLIRRKDELDVLPIVGMAGKGKTTFARKLYNDNMIVSHFDSRAWCCITQAYDRRDLLQEMVSQVSGSKEKIDKVDELADMLRKRLLGKRYLIVLDDMWDIELWDDLKLSFPDRGNGSRIIVTTRLEKVGELVKHRTYPYFLPFLTTKDSCKLLLKKVFQKEFPPPELYVVSLAVAERCRGLPLVIILIAGIIKRKKMEASWWHEVKDSLYSHLGRESEEYSRVTMHFSYDNLPDHLRPCLLYMGMFQEDEVVPVTKLTSLWIAEGFVENIESGRLEEAAESYLMDLISSNVVMVSGRRYDGKVKSCKVHDVVHHFCLERSREEAFMLAVKGHIQPLHWNETRVRFDFDTDPPEYDFRSSRTGNHIHQQLRSLITCGFYELAFPEVSKLSLLKVLDLSSHRVSGTLSSTTFHSLIHLKYLSVRANVFVFHPETHLCYLETLMLDCDYEFVVSPAIWKMEKLRHVEIQYGDILLFGNNKQQFFEEFPTLENLRISRGIAFPVDADSMDVLLQRCPNLQDLKISIYPDEHSADICTSRLKLESLTQLQSLHLSFDGGNIIVSELHVPSNLKKLVLKGPYRVSMASLITGLPSLEYLKLSDSRYQLEEWCLGDITFDKLKFLKLKSCGISRWDASEESFPQLEKLVIKWCDKLEEIPLSFGDIQTLKRIELIGCKKESLEASAAKIKEEVKDIEGCDRIELIIVDYDAYC